MMARLNLLIFFVMMSALSYAQTKDASLDKKVEPKQLFGDGKSNHKFLEILLRKQFWNISKQKIFTQNYNEPKTSYSHH